ncbi:MAG: TonB family protein [Pseudomonadota bacterium]
MIAPRESWAGTGQRRTQGVRKADWPHAGAPQHTDVCEGNSAEDQKKTWAKFGFKSAIAGGVLGALALGAGPASAQTRSGEMVFVDLGRWVIVERTDQRFCELRLKSNSVSSLVFAKSAGRSGTLQMVPRTRLNASFVQGSVSFEFDDTAFLGRVAGGVYTPSSTSPELETRFRQARNLIVRHGGQVIANLSLKTSSAGFRLLNQCADQWRDGWTPRYARSRNTIARAPDPAPAQTPAPTRPAPQTRSEPVVQTQQRDRTPPVRTATGPYPPNRALTPLRSSQWVRAEDFRRIPDLRGGQGVLRFTLLVNEEGRVEECAVNTSTGSRELDAKTCRTLQKRARFMPATDANGDARPATYSSDVRFAPAG